MLHNFTAKLKNNEYGDKIMQKKKFRLKKFTTAKF